VRSEIIRIYKAVHTWTGILSGMALFVAFYAGAITLFKEQLADWATPPAASAAERIPLSEAQTLITKTIASQPDAVGELEIHIDRAELLTWKVQEGADEHDQLSARHFVAQLGSDGSVRAAESQRTQLAELIDVLHRVVGLPVDTDLNRTFMGVIAVLYFVALASGLITLLPSLIKDFFALRVGPNLKRMWLDAHNIVGLGSFPFHLIMALTAAVFAFHDPIYFVQNTLIHDGKLAAAFRPAAAPGSDQPRDPSTMVSPQEIVARVKAEAPDFEPTVLRYMRVKGPSPSVFVFGHDRRGALEQRALGGIAMIDPYTGRITSTAYLPGRQSIPETMLASFFALHFGSFGGAPLKWMYFVLALLGAWLVYSGNLLWIESRGRKAKARVDGGAIPVQRRDTRLMASATVGVCLGAVCGISLTICCAKWLHGHVASLNEWHRVIYYSGFFAAVTLSFYRGAARAAVDLLRAAAALTLAIPLTSLTAAIVPTSALWTSSHAGTLAVDLTAAAVGLAFSVMARRTARRVRDGRADSVWSAQAPVVSDAGKDPHQLAADR
jgi:uncharacterized iron-regulated membrane protein